MHFSSGCHWKKLPHCVSQFCLFTLWWWHGTNRLRTCLSFILLFKQVFRSCSHTRLIWTLFQHLSLPWVSVALSWMQVYVTKFFFVSNQPCYQAWLVQPACTWQGAGDEAAFHRRSESLCLTCSLTHHHVCQILQLCPYHSQLSSLAQHTPMTMEDNWADALLGFGRIRQQTENRTLESEVDAYLLDMGVGLNVLAYWQVGGQYFEVGDMIKSNLFLGESRAPPNNFFTCNGHPSHSRFCCAQWESFFVR